MGEKQYHSLSNSLKAIAVISVASLLGRLDIVEGDAVLKMDFRMATVSKIAAQDDEIEWQHLIPKSNVDIISLMSSYNKLEKIFDSGR